MGNTLNRDGEAHANSLIDAGKVDRASSWSFSAEDGSKLLGPSGDDWGTYGKFHLGEDKAENEKTKDRYKYPYGKDGKVYRSGLIAAKRRASQQGDTEIANAADKLLDRVDKVKETPNENDEKEKNMNEQKPQTLLEKMVAAFRKAPAAKPAALESTDDVPELVTDAVALVEANEQNIAEITRLHEEVARFKEADAKREADAKVAAEAERAKTENERKLRIQTEADAFTAQCANAGKAATESLRAMFVAAKESNDEETVKRLEVVAASFVSPAPDARLPENGPSAEQLAARVKNLKEEDIGAEAARRIKDRGIKQGSPKWTPAYTSEVQKIREEMKGGSNGA